MQVTLQFASSISHKERVTLTRVVRMAKCEEDIATYTRKHGLWMIVIPYYKRIIFMKA